MNPYGVIYRYTNCINNKVYIGQTTQDSKKRWKQHVYSANKRKNCSSYDSPFYCAIRKYGAESFIEEIICECETQEELDEKEKYFCNILNAWSPYGYNLKAGKGRGSVSDETRKKQSRNNIGKGNPNFGNHALSGENNPMFGKHHTPETIEKLSLAAQGKYVGENNPMYGVDRSGEKSPMFGKHHSPETKEKISRVRISLGLSSGVNNSMFGKQHSDETKEKMAQKKAKTFYFISPEGQNIIVNNLNKFCRETAGKLNNAAMHRLTMGKQKSHKGWTRDESHYSV